MCGILGLARGMNRGSRSTGVVRRATELVQHRGPDDEGYLLWDGTGTALVYAGRDTAVESRDAYGLQPLPPEAEWRVAF